jgi:hypothetical protein
MTKSVCQDGGSGPLRPPSSLCYQDVPSTEDFAIAEIFQMEVITYFCYCLVGVYKGCEDRDSKLLRNVS